MEEAEKTKVSRLAREIIVALPVELTLEQNVLLIEEYVQTQFVSDGMCADVCIHDTDGHNPHAHILLTIRPLKEDGTWQSKTEKEYLCIRDGIEKGFTASELLSAKKDGWEKQYLYSVDDVKKYLPPSQAGGYERLSKHPKSSKLGRQNPITEKWNSPKQLTEWRKAWADEMNLHLERAGYDVRVDHRSFKAQGIDRQPTIHEGVFAIRMERKGRKSDRREINRTIFKDNSALAYWAEAVINLTKALVLLIPVIANVLETIRVKLTVLIYDWKYNRGKMSEKRDEIARMKKAVPYIKATNEKLEQLKKEKSDLEDELQHTLKVFKKRRAEIETKLYGLNEKISEWTTEHNALTHIAGSTVEIAEQHIKSAEERLAQLENWEEHLDEEIDAAISAYREKMAEAANCNQDELHAERMKLRPQKYAEAYDTIEKQYYSIERKTANPRPIDPYSWDQTTVRNILDNRQYTGCAVNGKSSIVSYKVHKTIEYDESEWQIIPNMQEPIIDEETFNIVHQMRQGRRRNTATGRTSMFSGLTYCGDCGSKMYFCASKSINDKQEFFRCSAYKENRGTCSIHFIRNVVLEDMVLETVKKVANYISDYEPVFLYLYAKNHKLAAAKEMRNAKLKLEQAKKRVGELDKLIKSVFEQHILGNLSEESYRTMIADYEKEQREVKQFILESETEVQTAKQESTDLKEFLSVIRKCTDITELTPTLVNTLIKKIEIFNSVIGADGKKHVPITIHFRAAGIIIIPDEKELIAIMEEIRNNPANVA